MGKTIMTRVKCYGVIVCSLAVWASLGATLSIDTNVRYQMIEGWGTCLAWWDTVNTPYYQTVWRQAYRNLGCNILRVALSKSALVHPSGNYATPVVLSDNLQANISLFDFNRGDVRVFGDFARWLRANALEPNRVKIVGSVWSPPHWMKGPTGMSQYHVSNPNVLKPTPWLAHDTWGDSIGGRLLQDSTNLTQFGRYLAAWIKGFEQRYTVSFYAVSLQNEVSFENPFDSCTYEQGPGTPGSPGPREQWWQYASALKAVKDAFARYGVNVKIKGPHCAGVKDTPASPWELHQQMNYILAVKQHSDPELIDRLDIYGSNGYMDSTPDAVRNLAAYWRGRDNVPGNWAWWLYAPGVMFDNKPTWFSESCGEEATWLAGSGGTPGNGALVLAQRMHNALVHANVSAYLYWQMSDSSSAENDYILLGKNNLANPHASKKYCAYKHFSRYVRPGARRVRAVFENGLTSIGADSEYNTYASLNASAYVHDEDLTLTIVLVNMRATAQSVTVVLPPYPAIGAYQVYRTKNDENFAQQPDLVPSNGRMSLTVPGYSVVTLYGFVPEPNAIGLILTAVLAWRAGKNGSLACR
ncbi:MAG: hypothetical protein N2595_03960 [bacterium]|nr:hypothetical protein [bacterium]